MGRATVRAAIVDYLQQGATGGNIPSLSTVFAHPAKFTTEGDFYDGQGPGIDDGAVIYVYLREQDERRIAIGGPHSGWKARPYTVVLICVLRHKGPDAQDADAANDAFIDGLVSWIEADRTASSTAVFQWGEGDDVGGVDIHVEAGMPKPIRQQTTQVFTTVEVTALELVNT